MKIPRFERKGRGRATEMAGGVIEDSGLRFNAREVLRPEIEGLITRLKKEGVFDFLTSDMPLSVRTILLYFPEKWAEFRRFEQLALKRLKSLTNGRMVDGFVQAYPEHRTAMRNERLTLLQDIEKSAVLPPHKLDEVYTLAVLFPERIAEWREKVRPVGDKILGYLTGDQNSLGKLPKIWMGAELVLLCPEYRPQIQRIFQNDLEQLSEPNRMNASVFLNVVYAFEIIYGTDRAELNEKGEVEFKAKQLESRAPLPDRPTL